MDVLCLLDTRMDNATTIDLANQLPFANVHCEPAIGQSGGLIVLWTNNNFAISVIDSSPRCIHCRFRNLMNGDD